MSNEQIQEEQVQLQNDTGNQQQQQSQDNKPELSFDNITGTYLGKTLAFKGTTKAGKDYKVWKLEIQRENMNYNTTLKMFDGEQKKGLSVKQLEEGNEYYFGFKLDHWWDTKRFKWQPNRTVYQAETLENAPKQAQSSQSQQNNSNKPTVQFATPSEQSMLEFKQTYLKLRKEQNLKEDSFVHFLGAVMFNFDVLKGFQKTVQKVYETEEE